MLQCKSRNSKVAPLRLASSVVLFRSGETNTLFYGKPQHCPSCPNHFPQSTSSIIDLWTKVMNVQASWLFYFSDKNTLTCPVFFASLTDFSSIVSSFVPWAAIHEYLDCLEILAVQEINSHLLQMMETTGSSSTGSTHLLQMMETTGSPSTGSKCLL